MDLTGFNAEEVEPNDGFSPIPAGEYPAIITDSKAKPTKAGDGEYLELKIQILRGPQQNRVLFDRLNLKNKSEKAVEIAQRTLSSICRAVNVLQPGDSSQLHSKPLSVAVRVVKDNQGNMRNEVKGYKRMNAPSTRPAPQDSESPNTQAASGSPFATAV